MRFVLLFAIGTASIHLTPRHAVLGALDLKLWPPLRWLYLNFNYHLTHHLAVWVPWNHLPSFVPQQPKRGYLNTYLSLWQPPESLDLPSEPVSGGGLLLHRLDAAACNVQLMETIYKGKIRPWGKTRGSLTTIPIAEELVRDLVRWQKQCPDPSPEAFIFAAPRGGFMDSSNYRKRVLHKLAKQLGLPKLTFQVIRRTIATLGQKLGTVKDVQGILRHSRPGTTTDVYMQEIPESVRATVTSIHSQLQATNGRRAAALAETTKTRSAAAEETSNTDLVVTMSAPATESRLASEQQRPQATRGKVLEFATRMRQGRGREVLVNA